MKGLPNETLQLVATKIEQLSSITPGDYIAIVTSVNALYDRELQCKFCKRKHRGHPERQKNHQAKKGCFELIPGGRMIYRPEYVMEGSATIKYERCAAYFVDPAFSGFMDDYALYQKGIMPETGGHWRQSAKFAEAMNLIHNLISERQSKAEAILARKNGRPGKI